MSEDDYEPEWNADPFAQAAAGFCGWRDHGGLHRHTCTCLRWMEPAEYVAMLRAALAAEQAAHGETRAKMEQYRADFIEASGELGWPSDHRNALATTEAALEASERERDAWQIRAEVAEEIAAEVAVLREQVEKARPSATS